MRTCDLLASDPNGKQEVLGQISWDGKKLHLSDGLNPDMLLGTVGMSESGPVNGRDNPGEWFERLPNIFNGSRLRAKMRGEKESDMISDNDTAARLHRALDRVLDRQGAASDNESGRSNVARKAWETRHETGGTQKFSGETEGRRAPATRQQTHKPFGWARKATQVEKKERAAPLVKPIPVQER
jgi:hypothetical protein